MLKNWVLLLLLVSSSVMANPLEDAAKEQGFFFFYSASCPHCQRFAPVLQQFSKHYGFKVVAISMDGGFLPSFPHAVMNDGQSQRFAIKVLPALFLVKPASNSAALVSEGAIDESELIRRLQIILGRQAS